MTAEKRARWLTHTVDGDEAGKTVEEILIGALSISRRMMQRLTRSRGIRLNGRAPRLAARVKAGDRVAARVSAAESPVLEPVPMELSIVHEDADLLVVDKPACLLVHPTSDSHRRTLVHGIAHHLLQSGEESRVRPVHRLDRDTSGLVLIAKTAYAHQHLDRQLRERAVLRRYLAFVEGFAPSPEGMIDAPIGRHVGQPRLRAVRSDGEPARTRYRVVAAGSGLSLLEIELETGRTHQIRVHLQHLGLPIAGDRQYGSGKRLPVTRQALHAHHISFAHPISGTQHELKVPLPGDLEPLRSLLDAKEEVS